MVWAQRASVDNTPLALMDVKGCELDVRHCQVLAELIRRNHQLTHLILDGTALGNEGAMVLLDSLLLQPSSVVRLDLANNGIAVKAAPLVADLMVKSPSLLCLDLRGNSLSGKAGQLVGKALGQPSCRLQILRLEDSELDDRGLSAVMEGLAANSILLNLHLGLNGIDVRGARIMRALLVVVTTNLKN